MDRATWCEVQDAEYRRFVARVEADEATVLDPYGATAPEEFFAVASESFFVDPLRLRAEHAALYAQLARLYGQDPAEDTPPRRGA
jgi:Mlc titration factor MtfA (ptsG expression regulator)